MSYIFLTAALLLAYSADEPPRLTLSADDSAVVVKAMRAAGAPEEQDFERGYSFADSLACRRVDDSDETVCVVNNGRKQTIFDSASSAQLFALVDDTAAQSGADLTGDSRHILAAGLACEWSLAEAEAPTCRISVIRP